MTKVEQYEGAIYAAEEACSVALKRNLSVIAQESLEESLDSQGVRDMLYTDAGVEDLSIARIAAASAETVRFGFLSDEVMSEEEANIFAAKWQYMMKAAMKAILLSPAQLGFNI